MRRAGCPSGNPRQAYRRSALLCRGFKSGARNPLNLAFPWALLSFSLPRGSDSRADAARRDRSISKGCYVRLATRISFPSSPPSRPRPWAKMPAMRAALLAAGLLLGSSCGGSADLPTSAGPVPAPRVIVLDSGSYVLTVTLSTSGTATCQNGVCTSISLCAGNPSAMTAAVNVTVERVGDMATVRAEGGASLLLTLNMAPTFVSGTISGSARDAQGVTVVTTGTLTGAAAADPASLLSGNMDGQVSMAGGSCSNNGHTWTLARL